LPKLLRDFWINHSILLVRAQKSEGTGIGKMIPVRLEKPRFTVEEMQLAFYLTQHLTDPFVARTLARHILIRAENVEHARALRKPLNQAPYDTTSFQKTQEEYASNFEEYFKVSRHRPGMWPLRCHAASLGRLSGGAMSEREKP
jgi:hypothetical protein